MYINLDDIEKLSIKEIDKLYKHHFNKSLYKLFKISDVDIHFVKAEGMNVWDNKGNKYLDFVGGYGALNLGHNHPKMIESLKKHFKLPNLLTQSINTYNGVLANNISHLTNDKLSVCHFTTSGTETVEEAIKLSLMYKGKGCIVYCNNGYHGKTLGSISALGDKIKKNYITFNKSFVEIPFGDFEALKKANKRNKIAAFLVEPIQGEGGINIPPKDYFKEVREFCDENNIILILDEIQTGLGRCGTMFYYEQLDIVPDILCLSKSLSGGIIPIGCIAVKDNLWKETYGKLKNATLLGTTFGGNTFASICGIKALDIIKEEKLYDRSKELGEYALAQLNRLKDKHDNITDIRGCGLLIGIEFGHLSKYNFKLITEFMMSSIISKMLKEYKIICAFTNNNPTVLRLQPPLIVNKEHVDYFIGSLDKVLSDFNKEISLLLESAKNATEGLFNYIKES